jgi:hypothetical protein
VFFPVSKISLYLVENIIVNHEIYVVRKLDSIRTKLQKAEIYRVCHDLYMCIFSVKFSERENYYCLKILSADIWPLRHALALALRLAMALALRNFHFSREFPYPVDLRTGTRDGTCTGTRNDIRHDIRTHSQSRVGTRVGTRDGTRDGTCGHLNVF